MVRERCCVCGRIIAQDRQMGKCAMFRMQPPPRAPLRSRYGPGGGSRRPGGGRVQVPCETDAAWPYSTCAGHLCRSTRFKHTQMIFKGNCSGLALETGFLSRRPRSWRHERSCEDENHARTRKTRFLNNWLSSYKKRPARRDQIQV